MMIKVSNEQQAVIDEVKRGSNVVVDAVAGSGKTTTILAMAEQMPEVRFLQIAYNTQLRFEVQDRVAALGLKNIEVHTYHSISSKHYGFVTRNDDELEDAIVAELCHELMGYDVVVLDEAQDIRPLLHRFAMIFIPYDAQLVIIGDRYQCIYEFMNADRRYLTHAQDMWGDRTFVQLHLNVSHRVPMNVAAFINKAVLREERIISRSEKNGCVRYAFYNSLSYRDNDTVDKISAMVLAAIDKFGIDEVFILAPSIKKTTGDLLKKIENRVVGVSAKNYCYYAISDEDIPDIRTLRNKLVFSTFHQSKGRERKVVFVLRFDQTYLDYYARDYDGRSCPDPLYVALTRAKSNVVVIGSAESKQLPFIDVEQMAELSQASLQSLSFPTQDSDYQRKVSRYNRNGSVTDIVRSIPYDLRRKMRELIMPAFVQLHPRIDDELSSVETVINFGDTYENVSHYIGNILPRILLDKYHNKSGRCEDYMKQEIASYCAYNGLQSPRHQITHYNWLRRGDEIVNRAFETLNKLVFGTPYGSEVKLTPSQLSINGRIDAVSKGREKYQNAWEFKSSNTDMPFDAFLQLMLYALNEDTRYRCYYLFNIVTCEFYCMNYADETNVEIMNQFEKLYQEYIDYCNG